MPDERASMNDQLILDRYRLIERLAAGGSAEVWRAHDEQLDRPVAVKRLHPHLFADGSSRARLAAEAKAAGRLSHPVIVGVYDVDATGDAPALVMELVDGESLAARIDRAGPLPPREAAGLVAEVADALYHAHQQGVIHRDVKPGNVLLARDGRVRLVDFGIAHSLAAAAERLTVTGTVIGTLGSMAPEQLADAAISPRTDLYGLGVVLYQALTGRPPYQSTTPLALAEAQRGGPPPLEDVDPTLAAVITACLAYDPVDRPLHAGALAAALRDWLAGDDRAALALVPGLPLTDAAAATRTMPVAAIRGPLNPAPARTSPSHPAGRRRRSGRSTALPLLALLGMAALAVLLGSMLMRGDGDGAAADVSSAPTATAAGTTAEATASTPPSAPAPTPVPPKWLTKLIAQVAEQCSADVAAQAEPALAGLSEDEAKDIAEQLVDACKEAGEGDGQGNGNGSGGNGGGGGGNNGGGNDD